MVFEEVWYVIVNAIEYLVFELLIHRHDLRTSPYSRGLECSQLDSIRKKFPLNDGPWALCF
jgi:hypothetical protein